MPESQPDPEPPSTSLLPIVCNASGRNDLRCQILFEAGEEFAPVQLTEQYIEQCCLATLQEQNLLDLSDVAELELSVQLLDAKAMQELNLQYRGKDSSTNVLSFAAEMPLMVTASQTSMSRLAGGLLILGDLVLCPDVIAREASEQSKSPLQHWVHMLVHGTLHLCGYDHEVDQEAQTMEALEIRIISGLGLSDPYAVTNVVNEQ